MKKSEINVLIVEDNEESGRAIQALIERAGYCAILAQKPDQARFQVKIKAVHAVIMDCMLPKINGIELAIELRDQLVDDCAIVLISGIFQDKNFVQDALHRTGAVRFLNKPLVADELISEVERALEGRSETPRIALHSLLSKPFASYRERRKAIDHVETTVGFDLPFIICIFMDAQSSGHLNISNQDGEIYGIGLFQGEICQVDSSQSAATTSLLLMDQGYISSDDLERISQKRGEITDILISENLLSPHVKEQIKLEQMTIELGRLITNEQINLNFVPDRRMTANGARFGVSELEERLHDYCDKNIDRDWLVEFYSNFFDFPIRKGPKYTEEHHLFEMELLKNNRTLLERIKLDPTIEELAGLGEFSREVILKVVHLLAIRRLIIFDDVKRASSHSDLFLRMGRIERMLGDLEGLNAFEIFTYFGAKPDPNVAEVKSIYKDFARDNHPDKLPEMASSEIVDLANKLFSVVTEAYTSLNTTENKERFVFELRQRDAENQLAVEQLEIDGLTLMGRGEEKAGFLKLRKAFDADKRPDLEVKLIWAMLKLKSKMPVHELENKIGVKLKSFGPELREDVYFHLARGLYLKALGQYEKAYEAYKRGLRLEPDFLILRREVAALSSFRKAKKNGFKQMINSFLGTSRK